MNQSATPIPRLTYVLQFHRPPDPQSGQRGQGGDPLTVATGLNISTRITEAGFDCSQHSLEGGTATLDLTFITNQESTLFFEWGSLTVDSPSAPMLIFRSTGAGQLSSTPDSDGFNHGTVMYEATGGRGMFEGAQGFITSNFLVNLTTNELFDLHLGVLRLE